MKKSFSIIIVYFICSFYCKSQIIDSTIIDLTVLYNKIGKDTKFRIIDANATSAYALIKASDSLYYILEPNKIHGPFHSCKSLNYSHIFITYENGNEGYIYNIFSEKKIPIEEYHIYSSSYPYVPTKSISYKNKIDFFILQDNDKKYGPFKIEPNILFSDSTNTIYQIFKDEYEFDLFKNQELLGKYKLSVSRYNNYNSDSPRTDLTRFKDKNEQIFYVEKGQLNGPFKYASKLAITWSRPIPFSSVEKYIYQNLNEDFYSLKWQDTIFQIDLKSDLHYPTFQIFPDSSITTEAINLKKYSYLRDEPELYYYNTIQGLITPLPIEKKNAISPSYSLLTPISKYFYYYRKEYSSYADNYTYYIFYKAKYIDSLKTQEMKSVSVVNNNLFYKKNNNDYMNGKLLKLPRNEAACIYKKDTFYIHQTTPTTWELYKNGKVQKTIPLETPIDNIRKFSFKYLPPINKLFIYIETGYGEGMNMYCPHNCYGILYDIVKNAESKGVRFDNWEQLFDLNGNNIDFFEGEKSKPVFLTIKNKKYPFIWLKQLYQYDNNSPYQFINVVGNQMTLYYYQKN